jgi:hypothetical protein
VALRKGACTDDTDQLLCLLEVLSTTVGRELHPRYARASITGGDSGLVWIGDSVCCAEAQRRYLLMPTVWRISHGNNRARARSSERSCDAYSIDGQMHT